MIDYKNGKIYKIVSMSTNKIYIGSTCNLLSNRLSQHKTNYKYYLSNGINYITSIELIKLNDYNIILLQNKSY